MYYIIIYDYKTGFQKVLDKVGYKSCAWDLCDKIAFDIVIEKEGIKYLDTHNNNYNHKGYSVMKKKNSYKIYHKEPNGIFTNGKLTKLFEIFFVKIDEKIRSRKSEMDGDWKIIFDRCIEQVNETVETIEN